MLNNLKAELVRKGYKPVEAVYKALNCTPKTARSKLKGESDFSVPEALQVVDKYFCNDNIAFEYLFATH